MTRAVSTKAAMAILILIFLGGCFQMNTKACRDMCPLGVKEFDGDRCTCMKPDDLKETK